jgi:hypothetical protein
LISKQDTEVRGDEALPDAALAACYGVDLSHY